MLRKLLKYEFRSTARIFGLCYLALLAAAVLARIFSHMQYRESLTEQLPQWFSVTATAGEVAVFTFIAMMMVVAVVTLILIIQRFYKNLLGEEGYLMHTLPVTAAQQVLSKLIAAVCWSVLSVLVCVLALVIFSQVNLDFVREVMNTFFAAPVPVSLLLELPIMALLALTAGILQLYAAMMIGHQAAKHRVLLSVAAYFGIDIALNSVVSGVLSVVLGFGMNGWLTDLVMMFEQRPEMALHLTFGIYTVFYLALSVLFFCIASYLMKKRLNLE